MRRTIFAGIAVIGLSLLGLFGSQAQAKDIVPDKVVVDTGIRCVTEPCPSYVSIDVPSPVDGL